MEIADNIITEERQPEQNLSIPVIEEHIKIEKAILETGAIKITKKVTENNESINIPLSHDEHFIERTPMNVFVDELPAIRYEGDTMIIPVLKEVIVKRTLLVEEIRISKRVIQTEKEQNIMLRKETVTVERTSVTQ